MFRPIKALAVGLALTLAPFTSVHAADSVPPYIAAAVADAARPEADRTRDADRRPGEVVAFAGIKPGDKVADILPGGGYFTRVFSKVVGAKGKVYAVVPDEMLKMRATAADGIKALSADPGFANVAVVTTPINAVAAPEPLDVVWTSLNYHDLHNKMMGPADIAAFNKSVFGALKKGGTYIVIDHASAKGTGVADTDTLHRIDVEAVKAEVTGAGFVLAGESDILRHSADDHTGKVFDSGIRGKTDQFILKFRKP